MNTFFYRLKDLRIEKNKTQKEVATAIQTTDDTIYSWEKGRSQPSIEMLARLADFFECSIDYLVGREDDFGVISSSESSLSGEEERLLSLFRQLPNTRKKTILDTMSDMVSARKLSEDVS